MSSTQSQSSDNAVPAATSTAPTSVSSSTTASSTHRPAAAQNRPTDAQAQQAQRRRHHIRRRERISQDEFMLMTAEARRQNTADAQSVATTAAPVPGDSTNTRQNRSSAAGTSMPYDPFTDEYWYNVHNQALHAQQASLQQRRTMDEQVNEARRAYTGLTNILHRLRSNNNSPEPK